MGRILDQMDPFLGGVGLALLPLALGATRRSILRRFLAISLPFGAALGAALGLPPWALADHRGRGKEREIAVRGAAPKQKRRQKSWAKVHSKRDSEPAAVRLATGSGAGDSPCPPTQTFRDGRDTTPRSLYS